MSGSDKYRSFGPIPFNVGWRTGTASGSSPVSPKAIGRTPSSGTTACSALKALSWKTCAARFALARTSSFRAEIRDEAASAPTDVEGFVAWFENLKHVGPALYVIDESNIETFDRSTIIVPNSNLISGVVRNRVRSDRTGRILISIMGLVVAALSVTGVVIWWRKRRARVRRRETAAAHSSGQLAPAE